MAKILTSLLAAGLLIGSGYGVVYAVQNSVPVKVEESNDQAKQVPYGPDINLKFKIVGDEGLVEGTIKAPTKLMGDWQTGTEDAPITGTMTIRLVKSDPDLPVPSGEEPQYELVEEWENVAPDQEMNFTDKKVIIGKSWSYRAIAIYDGVESPNYLGILGVYAGIRPQDVTDFTVTAEKGEPPVSLTLTVPDGIRDADQFPGIDYEPARVYVMRRYRPVGTYDDVENILIWEKENPAVNTPLAFIDDNGSEPMPEGTYYYDAFVEWRWGESFKSTQNAGLFQDAPGAPQNIIPTPVEGGVLVTWDPVIKALGLGYLDPESVSYDVCRYFGFNNAELIASDIKETEFLDDLQGIEKQMELKYQIIAKNDKGQSGSAGDSGGISVSVIVGPPAPLPFVETFGTMGGWTMGPDMLWTASTVSGSASWATGQSAYYTKADYTSGYIYPSDSSKGLAYTTFASYSPDGEVLYTSGDIDFTGEDKGVVTFRYYGHPEGLVKLAVEVMRYDETIADLEEETESPAYETVWSGSIKAEKEGWIEVEAPFQGFADSDKINLRLRAILDETPENGVYIPAAVEYIYLYGGEPEETGTQKPYGPNLDVFFHITDDGEAYVDGTMVAPTQLMGDWLEDIPDTDIEGTMTIRLVKSCEELEIEEKLIGEWKDVAPAEEISFVDNDIVIGQSWQYRAIAIYKKLESEKYYGTMGVYTGIRPLNVTNLTVTSDKGQAPVTVSFTVPDGVRDAEDFPNIKYVPSRVFVTRQFTPIGTYDTSEPVFIWEQPNPEFDTPITFIDDNKGQPMEEGTYYYNTFVEWEWGQSFEESKGVGLFLDAPSTPENIVATIVAEGVLITWDSVVEPLGNGYLDPESVVYDVYRYVSYNNTTLIAENIKTTEFVDNLEGIDQQINMAYDIVAKNEQGQSYPGYGLSNFLIVGPACQLPFIETFSTEGDWNITTDMLWVNEVTSGDATWTVNNKAIYYLPDWTTMTIEPENSKGLIYTNFASYMPEGNVAYVSGDIDFTGYSEGKVTFRYYGHPDGLVKLSIEVVRDPDSVVEGEEPYVTVWSGSIKAEEEGWIGVTAPFSGFAASDKINLRIRAISDETPEDEVFIPAAIEYICLEATDGPSGIDMTNAEIIETQYFTTQGIRLANPEKGTPVIRRILLSNGKVITSKVIL